MLTDHRFTILKRAAAQDDHRAGIASDWTAGIDRLTKSAQRPGETYESAYDRITREGDGARFLDCLRKAEDQDRLDARGRPRKYDPGAITRSKIEEALSAAALKVAEAQSISFESAFAKILETPVGIELYSALRAAAPDSGE
jgi:hypothetical protein